MERLCAAGVDLNVESASDGVLPALRCVSDAKRNGSGEPLTSILNAPRRGITPDAPLGTP